LQTKEIKMTADEGLNVTEIKFS